MTAAFTPILLASPDLRQSLMPLVDMIIHVKRGREPSMYTDINYETRGILRPTTVVRDVAARDCVRLAGDCLSSARRHVVAKAPRQTSPAEDAFFAMKSAQTQNFMNTEGFWWYYIAQLEAGIQDFAGAIVRRRLTRRSIQTPKCFSALPGRMTTSTLILRYPG